mmetsp:Transcript_15036/g.35536  ORF Transcript_15036/g.35536 Transcript_15036/m.35536 type:complete len:295 (-) Transcript_15036:1507-2391(-)
MGSGVQSRYHQDWLRRQGSCPASLAASRAGGSVSACTTHRCPSDCSSAASPAAATASRTNWRSAAIRLRLSSAGSSCGKCPSLASAFTGPGAVCASAAWHRIRAPSSAADSASASWELPTGSKPQAQAAPSGAGAGGSNASAWRSKRSSSESSALLRSCDSCRLSPTQRIGQEPASVPSRSAVQSLSASGCSQGAASVSRLMSSLASSTRQKERGSQVSNTRVSPSARGRPQAWPSTRGGSSTQRSLTPSTVTRRSLAPMAQSSKASKTSDRASVSGAARVPLRSSIGAWAPAA